MTDEDVLAVVDVAETLGETTPPIQTAEPVETVETTEAPVGFLDQPFDTYSTTDGLLLLILLFLVIQSLVRYIRGCFSWL